MLPALVRTGSTTRPCMNMNFIVRTIWSKQCVCALGNGGLQKVTTCQQTSMGRVPSSPYSVDSKGRKPKESEDDEDLDAPYSYSQSNAAKWNVERSFGAQYSRPWWKVAPVSLGLFALVAWSFLRPETEIDKQLELNLSERLPDLFAESASGQVVEEDKEKSKIVPEAST